MSHDEKHYVVEFDDQGATCKRPDGSQEHVNWGDIIKVTIEATAGEASEAPAHVWILWGRDNASGCIYPGGATGAELLLVEMQSRLSHFDVGAVATALQSDENNTWLLWQLPGTNSPDGQAPQAVN